MATMTSMNTVADAISSGNFASTVVQNNSALNSIKTSLDGINTASMSAITDPSSLAGDLTKKTLDKINPDGLLSKVKEVTLAPPTGLTGLVGAAKGISGSAFSAISSSMKPLEVGVPQNLTSINLKNAAQQAGADVAGNMSTKDLATDITSKITDPSALASGVTNIPGGQSTIASIVNKGTGVSKVADTLKDVTAITKTASTAALNQISTSTASISSVGNLVTSGALTSAGNTLASTLDKTTSSVSDLTKNLQAGKQPLSALVSTGLPAAAAAALSTSMNSLSTSSPFPLKMPTVAESTIDRSELTTSVNNLLGDRKIPSPTFGATISSTATGALQAVKDKRTTLIAYGEERKVVYDKQRAIVDAAKKAYETADRTLPEGDPEIDKLGKIYIDEAKKAIAILNETSAGREAILAG